MMRHPKSSGNIVVATPKSISIIPSLQTAPLYQQKRTIEEDEELVRTVSGNFRRQLEDFVQVFSKTRIWQIVHLRRNDKNLHSEVDVDTFRRQVETYNLVDLSANPAALYTLSMSYQDFADKFDRVIPELHSSNQDLSTLIQAVAQEYNWEKKDIAFGTHSVFLSENTWRSLDDQLRAFEESASQPTTVENTPQLSRKNSIESDLGSVSRLSVARASLAKIKTNADKNYPESEWSAVDEKHEKFDFNADPPFQGEIPRSNDLEGVGKEKSIEAPIIETSAPKPPKVRRKLTPARKRWLCCTWFLTWWIWPVCLSVCGKMKRKDIQLAWREKLALNLIIFFMCAVMLFYIIGLGLIICPNRKLLKIGELNRFTNSDYPYVAIRDNYYLVPGIIKVRMNS
jgi:chitin synthase